MKKLFVIAGILVILDQLTKYFFENKTIEIFSFFSFRYAENSGAAFGILKGWNILFIVFSFVVMIACLYYYNYYKLPLTFLLAGTIGNLIDRILFGFVRDFISVSVWPIFNFADAYNTIGVILLIYYFYLEDKAYKRQRSKKK
mgnify:CR=1 FL=1|jgi:signal peptidase II